MEKDLTTVQPAASCVSGCTRSPPCFPVHEEFQYSRIHYCNKSSNTSKRGARWRNILRRLMRESKTTLCGSKPLSFQYDPVSYAQNFDEGCHLEEPRRLSHVFQDVRWDLHD